MSRDYVRDADGKFAESGGTSKPNAKSPEKPKRSTAKKVAIGAGVAIGIAAAAGGLKVRGDALARYDARTAAAILRRADATSNWP